MAPKVNLTKRVRIGEELRYCPVVEAANGRVRPHVVWVDGREEKHLEGAYYIEWRENAKRVRLSVGNDPAEAWAQRKKKKAELDAIANGVPLASANGATDRQLLSVAVTEYLEEVKLSSKPGTLVGYTTSLNYFTESCHRLNIGDVDRLDLLKFVAFLRDEKGHSQRTCWNKFNNVVSFLKSRGIHGLVKKTDWPRYTEEEPEVYEREDLDTLFAKCSADERLWFEFFLMTGMREQEVMHTEWSDLNLKASTVRVTHKPDRDWTPKAYKEREIPIPARLTASLKAWKAKANGCALLFPASGCNPKTNFLYDLKAVAERAGLRQDEFWLHKFRSTFATWHLWSGVDLRTVQQWLGHSDMKSTMRYLKPSREAKTHDKVNATFA
jgi:integrase/recombinase XerD